jgi:hypothetical protein
MFALTMRIGESSEEVESIDFSQLKCHINPTAIEKIISDPNNNTQTVYEKATVAQLPKLITVKLGLDTQISDEVKFRL